MPGYKLRKVPKKDLYWVVGPDGKHHSKAGLPIDKAKAQARVLEAASAKEVKGGSATHRYNVHVKVMGVPLKIYYEAAKASYARKNGGQPPSHIHAEGSSYKLVNSSPTLVFYEEENHRGHPTMIVGIRGTNPSENADLGADALIATGQLDQSDRYNSDLTMLERMIEQYPENEYKWLGAGHSLGGAILDRFIHTDFLRSGVSYNPAVERQYADSGANHRIYNEHDPLYWFMGQFAKVFQIRPNARPSDWVDYLSWVSPWWKVAYTGLKAHELKNFEGGRAFHGGAEIPIDEPVNLFKGDVMYKPDADEEAAENNEILNLYGAGDYDCPNALPIQYRPDGSRQFSQETCAVVNGTWDPATNKCLKETTTEGKKIYYDDTCNKTSENTKSDEQFKVEERKRVCNGNKAEPPYAGTPARMVKDDTIPRSYVENDWRVYTEEDCNFMKGEFTPFTKDTRKQEAKGRLWAADTFYAEQTFRVMKDRNFFTNEARTQINNVGPPVLIKQVPESRYKIGDVVWYNNKKWKAVKTPQLLPPQMSGTDLEDYVSKFDAPNNKTDMAIKEFTVKWKGWLLVGTKGYPESEKTTLEDSDFDVNHYYDFDKVVEVYKSTLNMNTDAGLQTRLVYSIFKNVNQQNIPPGELGYKRVKGSDTFEKDPSTAGVWEEIPMTEEEKWNIENYRPGSEEAELPYRIPKDKTYMEELKDTLKGKWGDCEVVDKKGKTRDMNTYCAPLNGEVADIPPPTVGDPAFTNGELIDEKLNNPNITYSEAVFNQKRSQLELEIKRAEQKVGKIQKIKTLVSEGKYTYVDKEYTRADADADIKEIRETPSLLPRWLKQRPEPELKPLLEWRDYREYTAAAESYFKRTSGAYSEKQLEDIGAYEKKVNVCPDSLKWDLGRPYTGKERLCFQEANPANAYGQQLGLTTVEHALGLDKKSKCYLPEKPTGTYGHDIAKDEKGKYVMATPDECYARQMAMFKEVADNDWWKVGTHDVSALWRRYASQGYNKLGQSMASYVSKGIQDTITKAMWDNILPLNEKAQKKAEDDRLAKIEKDMSTIFAKKFGIPESQREKFWADFIASKAAGVTTSDFFKQNDKDYASAVFDSLASEAERAAADAFAHDEYWSWQEALDDNAVRRAAERATVANAEAGLLPPSPRGSDADGSDIPNPPLPPDPLNPASSLPTPDEVPHNSPLQSGKQNLFGGIEGDQVTEAVQKIAEGLIPLTGDFWNSPAAFVNGINQVLGLTGESDVEKFARQNPTAPGQEDPLTQGMEESTKNAIQNPASWQQRSEALLHRRENLYDWFPLTNKNQLGYEPLGNRFEKQWTFPYDYATGIKPPPGATPLPKTGSGKAKSPFQRELVSEGISLARYLAAAKRKAKAAKLDSASLTWSTDTKHKLQIVHDGKVVRFGAAGMGDHIYYKLAGEPTAAKHRKAYLARAKKIRGDWASNKYSPNSLAIAVLW